MHENEWETNEELIEAAYVLCMSPEELWKAIESVRVFMEGAVVVMRKQCEEVFALLKQWVHTDFDLYELERKKKKALYKVDFTRPKIHHQVSCRKPKVARKIIY